MKKSLLLVLFISFLGSASFSQQVVRLYKGKAPGSEDWNYKEVVFVAPWTPTKAIRNVVDPTLEVFVPEKSIATGTAIIVCPGGGNLYLEYEREGTEVAEWLAKKGITAFVLKYRLNKTPEDPKEFMDNLNAMFKAQRPTEGKARTASASEPKVKKKYFGGEDGIAAINYVRQHANEYGVNPNKVGIMGFSAGAGVTMYAVFNAALDKQPNFAASVYGGGPEGRKIPANAPLLFIACAADDPVSSGSPDLYKAWREAGKSAELHIYSKGGHGFGISKRGIPVDSWIEQYYDWLKTSGF